MSNCRISVVSSVVLALVLAVGNGGRVEDEYGGVTPSSALCQMGINMPEFDISHTNANNATECRDRCDNNQYCKAFIHQACDASSAGVCWLKSTAFGPTKKPQECCCFGTLSPPPTPSLDTSAMIGAEYTPWRAGSQLWWANFSGYRNDVARDLHSLRTVLGFTVLRVFLHDHLWDTNSTLLLRNMASFLDLCAAQNMRVGFVFFDDCWNHTADLTKPCVPRQGVHNGCWVASPQDSKRAAGVSQFEPYVAGVVREFRADKRVAWWEVFNEPRRTNAFSLALRAAAYEWAKAQVRPFYSCSSTT